jgi:hypothetical protein
MTAHLDKARALIALAVNDGAAPGEASNAALAAVKLIAKHGLLEVAPGPTSPVRGATKRSAKPAKSKPAKSKPSVVVTTRREYASAYDGRCRVCGDPYSVGDRIFWGKGRGTACFQCAAEGR